MQNCSVVDIFCGVGGVTHGFVLEGFSVVAGIDADPACKYPYEKNNPGARFILKKIENVTPEEILMLYPEGHTKVLVGCAPCQPYSSYTKKKQGKDGKWELLSRFADLICAVNPDVVSMENVPDLASFRKGMIYEKFISQLEAVGYHTTEYREVYCPDYGVPQHRKRLVFFASKYGEVRLVPPYVEDYVTVRDTIEHLDPLTAGQISAADPLHKASKLSDLNLRRIRASTPGGTWRDWPDELIAQCHLKGSGQSYSSVYGRMAWDEPAPTITTECHGYGNGRFGHPEQDRAISLREAALLQTFPPTYEFVRPGESVYFNTVARFIGNAVPVKLGRAIAKSVRNHLEVHTSTG